MNDRHRPRGRRRIETEVGREAVFQGGILDRDKAGRLRPAATPQFSSVEVDDKRAKLEMLQTHVGAFYQTFQTTVPFDISYSNVARMDLYANNYVYRYDPAGRLMPPHILFASQQDAMLFMDLITSLRDAK